ncbi:TonB-dependent receptor [Hephaestia sp. GCM10023244]|uniref:TonB-dependent receptor n=1 Tax=unclassified Hephaestia TaxID=2631281 RepID=UPI00207797CD|nr:TonB-dependent receptor [Hephaestia sp. MAHUQ-44]MCM8731720.1 TonB-dependent receptor [Hephaestia sp. MAHUQ-44]
MTNRKGIVAALMATTAFAGPAFAQSTDVAATASGPQTSIDDAQSATIVVTGIRASQEKSIDLKREATAIVDAISAEDIGKLPDVTIVDALQRISGVQIQRNAGEGATVNIRGLPQIVTLLNGEQYLSPGNLGTAQPNLNDIPAQLMNAVVVYKTTDLHNAVSGISGTIDLRTRRPFDLKDGFTISGTGEYARGRDTKDNDYLFSGLASWRKGNFGVLASGAYSKANLGNNYAGISGGPFGNNDWGGAGDNWISPHGYDTFHREVERDRLGLSGAVQWEIDPGITLTGEVFYTKLKEHNRAAGMNISNRWTGLTWTTPTQSSDSGVISHGNGGPWLDVDQYDLDAWWVNSFTVNRSTDSHTTDFNLQLDYDRGGPFSFSLRGIHGDADYLSMNGQVQGDLSNWRPGGHTFTLFRNAADPTRGTFYPADIAAMYPASRYTNNIVGANGGRYVDPNPLGYGEDPQLHIDVSGRDIVWSGFDTPIAGGLGAGHGLADYMANKDSYTVAAYSSEGNQHNKSNLTAFRLDGAYDFEKAGGALFGLFQRVDVGMRASKRSTQIVSFHLFSDFYAGNGAADPNGCAAQWKAIDVVMDNPQCSAGEMVPNAAFNPALPESAENPAMVFQGYTVNRPTKIDEHNNVYFLDDFGSVTKGFPGVWVVDPHDFDDELEFQKRVFGNAFPVIVPGATYDVDFYEKSAYANAVIDSGRLHGNLGLKTVYTRIRVRQNQTGDTRAYGDTNLDVGDTFSTNSYWDWLPSVNLQYDVTDNLKLRASFAKTMIPLDLGNYGGGLQIFTADSQGPTPENPNAAPLGVRQVTGASSSGNPYLNPWRSNNYDLALEYYLGRASMFNVGLFKLDINSFVTTGTDKGSFPDQDGVIRREVPVSRPIQGKGGTLQGLEAGVKLAFSDVVPNAGFLRNFGIDANYTFSDSSQERRGLDGKKLPFQDNSKHQINFALWYQDSHFQARVAYNYRTPRLSGTFQPGTTFCTGNNDPSYCVPADQPAPVIPIFQDTAQYVDVNVTYNLTDNFAIYANASNLLGEIEQYYFQFDKDSKQFNARNEFEPRYSAGIRVKF